MPFFTDHLGNIIELDTYPRRIISLVPSQTELLFDLGLDEEVIGLTKFCVHPNEWFTTKTRVGGTKTVHIEKVKSLRPDLIIANKEENVKEQIEELKQLAPVYVTDISNLEDALPMIIDIGNLTNRLEQASALKDQIESGFNELSAFIRQQSSSPIKTAYLIWKDPYMAAGSGTFINDMLERCGFENVFHESGRYPEIEISELASLNCQLLLLSSEPYPFKQKHIDELQPLLPHVEIVLADGEMFSWYGSRLLYAIHYFKKLIALVRP
jgi:ABC-type Fe3+-hydroxamate transport system substrate-binding protein